MKKKTTDTIATDKEAKKEIKTASKNREIRWDRLDNTAHLFPVIAGDSMSNVYRISVTLTERIQPEPLQRALDIVLPKFDGFNLRLRQGVFWYYFEENGKPAPRVREENTFPCRFIYQNRNNSYMFRVTYYKYRINLEVFHVLTDGMGGINFLKELTYQYLRLIHPELAGVRGDDLNSATSLNREDSFLKNYRKSSARGYQTKKAYLIKGEKLSPGEFGIMHGYMQVPELKAVCKRYGVSINEYLVSVFVWSVYQECMHKMPAKRPIRVAVPVNLRPYFNSITTKNFFVMVSAEFAPTKEDYTFEEIVEAVKTSLECQIRKIWRSCFPIMYPMKSSLSRVRYRLFLKIWQCALFTRSRRLRTRRPSQISEILRWMRFISLMWRCFIRVLPCRKGSILRGIYVLMEIRWFLRSAMILWMRRCSGAFFGRLRRTVLVWRLTVTG